MPPGLTLDTAGRLSRRERPEVHGAAVQWGQCRTRSLSAARRTPADVKGGIAPPGRQASHVRMAVATNSAKRFLVGWPGVVVPVC